MRESWTFRIRADLERAQAEARCQEEARAFQAHLARLGLEPVGPLLAEVRPAPCFPSWEPEVRLEVAVTRVPSPYDDPACQRVCEYAMDVGLPEYSGVRNGTCGNCRHYADQPQVWEGDQA